MAKPFHKRPPTEAEIAAAMAAQASAHDRAMHPFTYDQTIHVRALFLSKFLTPYFSLHWGEKNRVFVVWEG